MEIVFQQEFRPQLSNVHGSKDYHEFRDLLIEMDKLLIETGVEDRLIADALEENGYDYPSSKKVKIYHTALRCNILKALSQKDFRDLSMTLADSELYSWFAGISRIDWKQAPSKTTLERFDKFFTEDKIAEAIYMLNRSVNSEEGSLNFLNRENPLNLDDIFADTTCVKANIHFPVDWVLLRDSVRTLIKAINLIRKHGLTHRIPEPEIFIRRMNILCIEMSQCRRQKDSNKKRKKILRKIKKILDTVRKHAERYYDLLSGEWNKTDLSEAQAGNILKRLSGILEQLPKVKKQAHERIIGERKVSSDDKILSLYEDDIHIIIRGKAGSEVEFGNGLYIAEQEEGLIVDWDFFKDHPPADSKLVPESIDRIKKNYNIFPGSYTTDKGFSSKKNEILLNKKGIYNGICPKSPKALEERIKDEKFLTLRKRRAQTEGRIGIFKNSFLGNPLRSKGFEHRKNTVLWCLLTHNLWILSRIAVKECCKIAEAA